MRVASTRRGIALALAAITLAVFVQVRDHDWVDFDDLAYIVHNPHVSNGLSWRGVSEAFTTPYWRQWTPLSRISLQISHEIHGRDPTGYLLTSLALHLLSTLLLFFTLARITGATWCSAFVAAVFAVHPLHVESVAWASQRKDPLSGLFWMLTLAAYARYAARPAVVYYALVFLLLVLGLLAKSMLVTLPFVLLLLDHWPLGRFGRRAVLEKLPLLVPVAAVSVVTLISQSTGGFAAYGKDVPLGMRLMNAVDAYVVYVAKSFWPSGLGAFYPHPLDSLSAARVATGGALLAAVTAAVVTVRRSRPYLVVGWFWYLGTLVPVIGFVQVGLQGRADRYMYLPLVGLSIMVAWGARDLARGQALRRVLAAGGAAAIAALAAAAWVQVGYWRDSKTLFEHAVAVVPDAFYAHQRLAKLRLEAGRLAEAEYHYTRVFELMPEMGRPDLLRLHIGLASQLAQKGDLEGALGRYRQAVGVDPENARANGLLGLALVALNRPAEARPYLERALRGEPEAAELHAALGSVAAAEGRPGEGLAHNREALRLDPTLPSARGNLAWLLATCEDPSLRDPQEALRLAVGLREQVQRPTAKLLDTVAAAYAAAGRFEEAVRSAEEAATLAEAAGQDALAQQIRGRLSIYRSGKPYFEVSSGAGPASGIRRGGPPPG